MTAKRKEKSARGGGKLVDGVICPGAVYRARRRRRRLTTTRDKRFRFAITTNNIIRQITRDGWGGGGGGENTRLPASRARVSSRNLSAHVTCARIWFLHTRTPFAVHVRGKRGTASRRLPYGCPSTYVCARRVRLSTGKIKRFQPSTRPPFDRKYGTQLYGRGRRRTGE